MDSFLKRACGIDAEIRCGEPMSAHTSFRIGGQADVFALPNSADALIGMLKLACEEGVRAEVVGAGSNLLVKDAGVRGVVISTRRLTSVRVIGEAEGGVVIEAECGVPLPSLAMFARDRGLAGLEFAQGIPGTFGGALCMNAGAYGGTLGDLVISVLCCDRAGNTFERSCAEMDFGYRHSALMDTGDIALSAKIRLVKGNKSDISAAMEDYALRRRSTQPLELPSAGSTFKRPEGYFAGKLISDAGLKGKSVGGAQVSCKHAGFIVNTGGATAADVLKLCDEVSQEVKKVFGVTLEKEIKVIGED